MTLDTMQDPTAAAHAGGNGGTHHPDDDEVVQALHKQIAARKVRVDELRAALADLEPELKRYERALAFLTGEGPKRGQPKAAGERKREVPARIGEGRVTAIRQAILDYAADHDEFRQVDIRGASGIDKSSVMALAFEQLRQEGFIRFARAEGNGKFFRLTREAVRELDA